jgi:hypothetical protein
MNKIKARKKTALTVKANIPKNDRKLSFAKSLVKCNN